MKSIEISRLHSSKSAPNWMRRLFRVNFSSSFIEWSLFEVPTHFLSQVPEIWTIDLVASTFKPNVDIRPHEKFNGALNRAYTHEMHLRLVPTKLIWASNSLPIGRSKLSSHDWNSSNQKIQWRWFSFPSELLFIQYIWTFFFCFYGNLNSFEKKRWFPWKKFKMILSSHHWNSSNKKNQWWLVFSWDVLK